MYEEGYYTDIPSSVDNSVIAGVFAFLGIWIIFALALTVFLIICNWKIYKKAGREGWEAIVPIYNIIVKFQFLNIPMWVLILCFIPGANAAVPIITAINMAKKFGKNGGFAVGLIFLPIIFYPILAFGDAMYVEKEPGIFEQNNNMNNNMNYNNANYNNMNNNPNLNTRYCVYCGSPINGKFCSNCGKENN